MEVTEVNVKASGYNRFCLLKLEWWLYQVETIVLIIKGRLGKTLANLF